MQVHLEPDLATQARITKSGSIVLPLLGEVKVAGISLHEAEYKIERLYYERDFLQSPQVSLRILQYSPRQVQVLGMVNVPGPVPFPEEEDMTLSEALSMAGGINRIGNARKIRLTRSFPGGGRATARYNLNAILGDPQVEDIQLKPGDIIYVPEDPLGAYYGTQ
jgi:polysaccharide export outer membrane protein